jgi:hypothetical protein
MSLFKSTLILFFCFIFSVYGEKEIEVRRATKVPSEEERFDQMVMRYAKKIIDSRKEERSNYLLRQTIIEQFETNAGPISIYSKNIKFGLLQSKKAAWIRIGKEQSSENSEAIKLFLKKAKQEKINAGYKVIEEKESPSDYGTTQIARLKRGDQYFTTYFQTTRILATYKRFYMVYTYFIEMGMQSRKQIWEKEQAEEKLGL